MSKKCSNCGEILEDDAKFCGKCGSQLNEFAGENIDDTYENLSAEPSSNTQQPKKKKRKVLRIVLAVIIIYVVIGIIVGLASSGDNSETTSSIDTSSKVSDTIWGTFQAKDGSTISIQTAEIEKNDVSIIKTEEFSYTKIVWSDTPWIEDSICISFDDNTIEYIYTDEAYTFELDKKNLTLCDTSTGEETQYKKISDDYLATSASSAEDMTAADVEGLYMDTTRETPRWIYMTAAGDDSVDIYMLSENSAGDTITLDSFEQSVSAGAFFAGASVETTKKYYLGSTSFYFEEHSILCSDSQTGGYYKVDSESGEFTNYTWLLEEVIEQYNSACNGDLYSDLYGPIIKDFMEENEYALYDSYALYDIDGNGIFELIIMKCESGISGFEYNGYEYTYDIYRFNETQDAVVDCGDYRMGMGTTEEIVLYERAEGGLLELTGTEKSKIELNGDEIEVSSYYGDLTTELTFFSLSDLSPLTSNGVSQETEDITEAGFDKDWMVTYPVFDSSDGFFQIRIIHETDGTLSIYFNSNHSYTCYYDQYSEDSDGVVTYDCIDGAMKLRYYPEDGNYIEIGHDDLYDAYYPRSDISRTKSLTLEEAENLLAVVVNDGKDAIKEELGDALVSIDEYYGKISVGYENQPIQLISTEVYFECTYEGEGTEQSIYYTFYSTASGLAEALYEDDEGETVMESMRTIVQDEDDNYKSVSGTSGRLWAAKSGGEYYEYILAY